MALQNGGLGIKKGGGAEAESKDERRKTKVEGRTKPLGRGAKGAWEGGLIIRGQRAKKS
jgi:hypothetical protein